MISHELKYLLDAVRSWFDEAEQIYSNELKSGPLPAELSLLDQLPGNERFCASVHTSELAI